MFIPSANKLRHFQSIALILIISFVTTYAQIPAGYYDNAGGKTGSALKTALYNIIKGHVEFPYTSSSTDVWDILKDTDRDTANSDNVILLYSGWSMNAAAEYASGSGWCREHVWAKSHGNFGETPPAGTDAHHLRPADVSVNSARGNKDFDNGGNQYIDNDDGPTDCYTDSDSWEPRDAVKGDVARMMFYMATRYEGENGEPKLELVDQVNTSILGSDGVGFFGKLSTLLEWHETDIVDDFERNRNEVIYSYQHNRNPFIDHPEYVSRIWGDDTSAVVVKDSTRIFFSEYIEGSRNNKALEIYNAADTSVALSAFCILSNYDYGQWYPGYYSFPDTAILNPGDVWVIVRSGADSALLNVADDITADVVVNFNGNDVRALVKISGTDTSFLDIIGFYNDPDSSTAWSVAGIFEGTLDHTLVRKDAVDRGNPDWTASAGTNADNSEWIVYDLDTFDYLGAHPGTPPSSIGLCNTPIVPQGYRLYPCYPNPFNPSTTIRYDLPDETSVTLRIFDLRGSLVNTLVQETQTAGTYQVRWNGHNENASPVAAGIYIYQIQTSSGFLHSEKMILLK